MYQIIYDFLDQRHDCPNELKEVYQVFDIEKKLSKMFFYIHKFISENYVYTNCDKKYSHGAILRS